MNRRCVTLFLLLVAMLALSQQGQAQLEKPNVIVVFTDDQTYRAIGYNNPTVKTPHLDALAASGVTFERAYVASPICAASRASMMTGRFPQQHGVAALDQRAFARYRAPSQSAGQTLPERLKKAGYLTAFYGKSHLGKPKSYGFDAGDELRGHDDVKTFEQASAFIKSRKGRKRPFFLWLAPRQPHVPLLPEQKWLDLYPSGSIRLSKNFRVEPSGASLNNQGTPAETFYRDSHYCRNMDNLPSGPPRDEKTMLAFTKAYYAVVSHLDDQIGKFTELIRETGLMENTVVIFLSDNGYHLGSHGLGNKITMHEESVRVPMFAFGAGVKPGQKTRALVSALDVYPTVLELAGAPKPPEPVMGKSLLPLLKDSRAPHRDTVFSECVGVGGKPGEGHRMARGDRWKLILSDRDEEFLFDQKNDPFELNNRVADPELAPVLRRLRSELAGWMKSIGDRPYPSDAGEGRNRSDFDPLDWKRPVDNPVFTTTFGNNHDSVLFVEPELEYPYHLIISHTPEAAHLWRARKFSWSSDDWELVSDQYKIGNHYEYDDGVKVDGTYYLYEDGIVYTFSGPLEEASGKWKVAGTFPHKQCDDIGVYVEDGVFHMFGEHGNFPHGPDGTSLAHFSSTTGLGDWKLVNAKAVDPNPDGGHTYGVGDATIAKIDGDYYIFCDRESKGSPYKVVAWRSKDINTPFEYLGKAITPRSDEVDDWDNHRIQDPDIAYIPELGGYVMTCNMMDRDGNPGGNFPTLRGKMTRVIGVFYHGNIQSEPGIQSTREQNATGKADKPRKSVRR